MSIAHAFVPGRKRSLSPLDAVWHLLNLFGPAIGLALIAPTLAKLLWRRALKRVSWMRLSAWVGSVCALVVIGGLLAFGHDGKMATYAAMTLGCALTLWRVGFASPSSR
jgi:TctA family transporter